MQHMKLRVKVAADAVEALLGAAYQAGGLQAGAHLLMSMGILPDQLKAVVESLNNRALNPDDLAAFESKPWLYCCSPRCQGACSMCKQTMLHCVLGSVLHVAACCRAVACAN